MRLKATLLCLSLLIGLPLAAQEPAPPPPAALASVQLPPELDRVLRDYEREWQARSAAGLAKLFTEDGFVLRPGHPPVRGRAEIERAYAGAGGGLSLRAFAFATSDSVGYIVGGFGGGGGPDAGKFILLLRRTPGGPWLIAADMDNGNRGR